MDLTGHGKDLERNGSQGPSDPGPGGRDSLDVYGVARLPVDVLRRDGVPVSTLRRGGTTEVPPCSRGRSGGSVGRSGDRLV